MLVPCVHIEMRIEGLDNVKGYQQYTFKNVINFNHHVFWEHHLNLMVPDVTELARLNPNKNKGGKWSNKKKDKSTTNTSQKDYSRGKTVWNNNPYIATTLEKPCLQFFCL